VILVKDRTARSEPVLAGTALIASTDEARIVRTASAVLQDGALQARMARRHSPYGDGRAGDRIATALAEALHCRGGDLAPA
jgi:UDP-N-acetylglucosamine 2-epimerase